MDPTSRFQMINVGEKVETHRRAISQGFLYAPPAVIALVQARRLPKGDVLSLAEAAGITGAKKTSEMIPLCHPLSIDSIQVRIQPEQGRIRVECEVAATAKTGVEMESLLGTQIALLTLYDLIKGVEPALEIGGIRLIRKEGGKKGLWIHPEEKGTEKPHLESLHSKNAREIKAAVLTLSDRASRKEYADESGLLICDWLKAQSHLLLVHECIPDDQALIRGKILQLLHSHKPDLLICTGGTGIGPRDVTPEALRSIPHQEIPGIGEFLRLSGLAHTPHSILSRSSAYLIDKTLILTLPGSPQAVGQSLDALTPVLSHALEMIHGHGH